MPWQRPRGVANGAHRKSPVQLNPALPSDKQWYIAIDDVRFRFHPSLAARLLIVIQPESQYDSHGDRTE
jgi:hypothetical protein